MSSSRERGLRTLYTDTIQPYLLFNPEEIPKPLQDEQVRMPLLPDADLARWQANRAALAANRTLNLTGITAFPQGNYVHGSIQYRSLEDFIRTINQNVPEGPQRGSAPDEATGRMYDIKVVVRSHKRYKYQCLCSSLSAVTGSIAKFVLCGPDEKS